MISDSTIYQYPGFVIAYSTMNDGVEAPHIFKPMGGPATHVPLDKDKYGWVAAGLNVCYSSHFSEVINGSQTFDIYNNGVHVMKTVFNLGDNNLFHDGFAAYPSEHKWIRTAYNNFQMICVISYGNPLRFEKHIIPNGETVTTGVYNTNKPGHAHVITGSINVDGVQYSQYQTVNIDLSSARSITATSDANVVVIVEY